MHTDTQEIVLPINTEITAGVGQLAGGLKDAHIYGDTHPAGKTRELPQSVLVLLETCDGTTPELLPLPVGGNLCDSSS